MDHFVSWNAGSQSKDLYVYDASGTRVLRRTTTSSGTTMTVYAFGLEEHTYFNAGAHKSDLYYYTIGGRLLGALDNNNKTTFYLTDALGSVLASFSNVASSAAIKGNQVYGPYGNSRDMQGSINTAKGFTGQYNDSLTGLDYYGSRYYDQVAGVFLSADTVQGNGSGANPYAYVGGNPETRNDPTGHDPDPNLIVEFVKENPWILLPMALALTPAGVGALLLIGTSIGIAVSPNRSQEPTPTNNPQPTGAPTPDETPTATPTPSTDTNGAMCKSGGCYNLVGDQGKSVSWYNRGQMFTSTAHPLAHVYISEPDLQKRAIASGGYASKYSSLEIAEWATQYALDHMTLSQYTRLYGLIGDPANAGQTVPITVNTGVEIGYGYHAKDPTRITTTWATIVVEIDNNGNPFVLTSYPQLNPPQSVPPLSPFQTRLINLNS